MGLNNINSKSTWGQAASDINTNFTTIDSDLKKVKNATTRNKGYFSTSSELISAFPTASKGDIAYVGSSYPYAVWKWNGSSWTDSGSTGGEESVNLGDYYTKEDTDKKIEELETSTDERFTETDAKLSELGSETDILSAINGTKAEKITPTILTENTAIRWDDNAIWSYEGFNRTQSITLNKGEAIFIKARVYNTMAALYLTSQNVGYGEITSLVQGKDGGVQSYAYRASEDNTYIGATYRVTEGIEMYRLTSEEYEQLQALIEQNINGIIEIKELHEIAPLPLSIGVGTGNNGKSFESSVRATTGVIKNERPLLIYVPKGYKIQYRSGNTENDLPNASYVKEDYEEGIITLDVEEPFVTLNLVAENDIAEDELINLIVAQDNTAVARLVRNYMDIKSEVKVLYEKTLPSISENLLNPYECENGKQLVDGSGAIVSGADKWVTGYIPVNPNEYNQILVSHSFCNRLAQYDAEKNYINITSGNISPLTLNENARYIRIAFYSTGRTNEEESIQFKDRFNVKVYPNIGYDVVDKHNIYDAISVKDSQYVTMQDVYPLLTDKDNMATSKSFSLLLFKGNQSTKNIVFTSNCKYTGEGYATIQFMYSYMGASSYKSPAFIIGGKDCYERKEWRIPPFLNRVGELNISIEIPEGGMLYFADFFNEYSNAITPFIDNGILMNAHSGFGYAPSNTQGAFVMAAKLGFPQIVTMPKKTSDGVWVCFHDDSNIGNTLSNEDGSNLDSVTATKAISDITIAELMTYVIRRGNSGKYAPPYKVPTIEEFFNICKKTGVMPMFSIHPLWSTSECENMKAFAKKHNVLNKLTLKMPIAESYFDYFSTLYYVFGEDVKSYALNCSDNSEAIMTRVKEMGIKVPVTIEIMSDKISEDIVKSIVNNGFRASVAPAANHTITGEMMKNWIKWGVTEFTEDHNCSFGLNW